MESNKLSLVDIFGSERELDVVREHRAKPAQQSWTNSTRPSAPSPAIPPTPTTILR